MTPQVASLSDIHSLVIDIDGVLWHGQAALPGVPAFFAFLQAHSIRFLIATNNSARPSSDIVARLTSLCVKVDERSILTSADATALYLPRLVAPGARVLVVGGAGIAQALTRAGFRLVDSDADIVVAGLDPNLTYDKLKRATFEIRRGAKFVGTNPDKTFPSTEGLAPGAGAILAAIQAATDISPIVIGKPERAMFDLAVKMMQGSTTSTAMLGDRLDTDIAGARQAGLYSILVLTGVTSRENLAQSPIQPDFVFQDLDILRQTWEDLFQTY